MLLPHNRTPRATFSKKDAGTRRFKWKVPLEYLLHEIMLKKR
jgi:hypothetical protein